MTDPLFGSPDSAAIAGDIRKAQHSVCFMQRLAFTKAPLIREQAFGEALDPDKLERLGRYEAACDALEAEGAASRASRGVIRFAK